MKSKLLLYYKIIEMLALFVFSRFVRHSIYLLFSLGLAFIVVDSLSISDLSPILSTLQNISAAVFTLAGIWIAYSYPEAISAYTNPDKVILASGDETKRIENLVLIILTSAFVIIGILAFNISMVLLQPLDYIQGHKSIFKLLAVTSVVYLAAIQTVAILTVMLTNIQFVNELHKKNTENLANEDL
ncbi:hypothetical protein Q4519_03410 [Motilimonas sp. 1_MG-2023]|uniref:hypothetical protein n=1 Tax=Motilimonas sp. 1_MG-2023 TaxID=3062672 RepID=UPI0026E156DD|nr:hypothetical protein [Motilimonas sp. 1_MG-2023]MDO6524725.1 hypothetical protein [Motilimonas sp. 1_MG-2023]